MRFIITALLITFSASLSRADGFTAYVVDQPVHPNEFSDLESAVHAVCGYDSGRVIVKKTLPLAISNMALNCDITIEAVDGVRAELVSSRQDDALVITASKSLRWSGFQFSIPTGLVIKAAGDLELKGNVFSGPTRIESTAGMRFDSNRVSDTRIVAQTSLRPVHVIGNQTLGETARLALDVKSALPVPDQNVFEVYKNTLSRLELDLCSEQAAAVHLDDNSVVEARVTAGSPLTRMRVSGGRLGRLILGAPDCAAVSRTEVEVARVTVDRLEAVHKTSGSAGLVLHIAESANVPRLSVNWHEKQTRSEIALVATGTKFTDEFSWDTVGNARLELDQVDVGTNANITHEGSIRAEFKGVRWQNGLTVNTVDHSTAASGSNVSVSQMGGASGGNFDVLANHRGPVSVRVLGLDIAQGRRVSIDRQLSEAARRRTGPQEGMVEIRDMQFSKPGNSLSISGIDGHVVIDNNKFHLDIADFGFTGVKLGHQVGGSTVVTRNEFVVPPHCSEKCAGLRAQDVANLLVQANKFFVYGKYAHGVSLKNVAASLKENEFRGAGHNAALIQVAGLKESGASVIATENIIDANGLTAVQLTGSVFSSFTGNNFSGNGVFNDGPGLDFAALGGLIQDPITSNTGLHDKNVATAVDFDGNGCRDIPREANIRSPNGECPMPGKRKPVFP